MIDDIVLFEELEEWEIFSVDSLGYFLKAKMGAEHDNANAICLTGPKVQCVHFEPNTPVVRF